ncbi:MAG: U32 family peptidase [Deltaproteobacteria bacterium]|uniref:peptidase U32 family protein n=1 Tax=Desulfobacula sp. TaxID=2593537 RepID=UPI0019BBBA0C|nr:U32 family peptidase [Candidatus Desulfobacula maris]MBL6993510.1 U32 family peptidase [Desulfobacula sp.]
MKKNPFKPELLAPAGNFEKLEIAIHYGADAVYLAAKNFSLRNFSGNFTDAEMVDAVTFARLHKVKVYLACNIYSRNHEQKELEDFLYKTGQIGPDAIIVSDPGIIMLAKKIIPDIDIHLSTQANTTNLNAARFWHGLGVKRVNLARELSLEEIKEITEDAQIETETFIHGAMCVSYSGRCLLSNFLSGRDSNRGLCSHPCRWKYSVVEELRPNEYHSLMEDDRGSYIFNSKDLSMIEHIPELINANITSLKIEGRMKGINYLASVVKTYRNAIDAYIDDPDTYKTNPDWLSELYQIFHREYCTGFYFNKTEEPQLNYNNIHQGKIHSFIGKIMGSTEDNHYRVGIRNKLTLDDTIEILSPKGSPKRIKIMGLFDMEHNSIDSAQPNTMAILFIGIQCFPNDIVRKI